jgi:hypothetical protein
MKNQSTATFNIILLTFISDNIKASGNHSDVFKVKSR